ncbi:MAG: hypothetical protein ABIK85_06560 [Candidatus Eisenbacteria bacterium]
MRIVLALVALCSLISAGTAVAADIHDAAAEGELARVEEIVSGDPAQLAVPNERNELPIHAAATGGAHRCGPVSAGQRSVHRRG